MTVRARDEAPGPPPARVAYRGRAVRRLELPELSLAEDVFEPRLRLAPHAHARASLVLVVAGSYIETSRAATYDVRPGGVLFQPAGLVHADRFGNEGARCFRLEFTPAWAGERGLAESLTAPFQRQGGPEAAVAAALYGELRHPDALSPLAVESALAGLLVTAARRQRSGGDPARSRRPPWLDRVLAALHDGVHEAPSLAQLGAIAGAHPGHVARTFRQHMGRSVGTYLREARVARARERLAGTDDTLARVATTAGFCDESHLARVFRKHEGMSPNAYRQAARGRVVPR